MKKIISLLFYILFLVTPLIVYPNTSELFEFNKMVFIYLLTTLIIASWVINMILHKKIILKRTALDIPLLLFLLSQIISTLLSINPHTSIFGYYSRFNGGLLSTICYLILYWAFVSNLDQTQTKISLKLVLVSGSLVAVYAILEHFGHSISCAAFTGKFNDDCWVQDVKLRVFATLGQPNWLAAWIVALIPTTWAFALVSKPKTRKFFLYILLSILFVSTLIFTKSRSGFLGFFVGSLIFAILTLKNYYKKLIIIALALFAAFAIFGSPWTPSIESFLQKKPTAPNKIEETTSLETGGTESGDIRKIVWKGAFSVFAHYPIFGTGVETFAYSYYQFRPIEHNLTSEWDFLYNKAHNEYLNYMANSGILGISGYLVVILFAFNIFIKNRKNILSISLLSGFASLLVSNFFGFSVTLTNLELFLFPAAAFCLSQKSKEKKINLKENDFLRNSLLVVTLLATSYFIFLIGKYWYADVLYSKARSFNSNANPQKAIDDLDMAITLIANEPNYHMELAQSYAQVGQKKIIAEEAVKEGRIAVSLNPVSINLVRSLSNVYIKLSSVDPQYLNDSVSLLQNSVSIAPNDPKLYFQLGLSYGRIEDVKNSIEKLKKAIDLKPDYKDARLALAIVYESANQKDDAKNQLEYILKYIAPGDKFVKTELEKLK